MTTYTRPRLGAMALGALFALGAAAVLLEDIRHSGRITIDHALSLVVLVGTIAAGHYAWGELKRWRIPTAGALALLFALGSAYCVVTTAGRTAGHSQSLASSAEAANLKRTSLEGDLA